MKRELAILGLLLVVVALIFSPATRPRRGTLESCRRNVLCLQRSLQLFSLDNPPGRYPTIDRDGTFAIRGRHKEIAAALRRALIPRYLKSMPICPAAGRDTYSETYQAFGYLGDCSSWGCVIWCGGDWHVSESAEESPSLDLSYECFEDARAGPCKSMRLTTLPPCRSFDAVLETDRGMVSGLRTSEGRIRPGDTAARVVALLGMPSEICDNLYVPSDVHTREYDRHYIYETEKFWLSVDFEPTAGKIHRPGHDLPALKVRTFEMTP